LLIFLVDVPDMFMVTSVHGQRMIKPKPHIFALSWDLKPV